MRPENNVIKITCSDEAAEYLTKLLSFLKYCVGIGHSVGIKISPDNFVYGFDGDGSSRISSLELNGEPVEDYKREKSLKRRLRFKL